MSTHPRISIDPAVCHGRPVVAGTRVLVAVITGGLAGGMRREAISKPGHLLSAHNVAC